MLKLKSDHLEGLCSVFGSSRNPQPSKLVQRSRRTGQSRRLPINRLLTSRFRTCRDAAIAHFSQENGDELHTSSARDRPDSIHFDYRGSHCGFFDIDHSFTGFVLRLKLDATERALPRRRVTDLRILSRRTGGQFGLSAFIAIFEWKLKPITERRRQPGQ